MLREAPLAVEAQSYRGLPLNVCIPYLVSGLPQLLTPALDLGGGKLPTATWHIPMPHPATARNRGSGICSDSPDLSPHEQLPGLL